MGTLNPNIQVIDVVLTERGKELLANNNANFKITKFAVADDEVDYNLYDTSQASSDDYGIRIKSTPLLEASTMSSHAMRYKLVTLPAGTTKIPILTVSPSSINVYENAEVILKPSIQNYTVKDEQMVFTAVLRNTNLGTITVHETSAGSSAVGGTSIAGGSTSAMVAQAPGVTTNQSIGTTAGQGTFISTDQKDRIAVVTGKSFKFTAAPDVSQLDSNSRVSTIEIFGNVIGGGVNISVTVNHSTATITSTTI